MSTSKQLFSVFILIFLIELSSSCKLGPQPEVYNSDHFSVHELTDGVVALIHKRGGKAICNVGIINLGKETLVFDTFITPLVAKEILKVVDMLGYPAVKYVVNSHYHNDHIRGNQVFGDDVDIISTKLTADLIKEREPKQIELDKQYAPDEFAYYDSLLHNFKGDTSSRGFKKIMMWHPYYEAIIESFPLLKTKLPNLHVEENMEVKGTKHTIQLITKGAGHTPSDLILWMPYEKILFTGDLLFNQCHPYLGSGDPLALQSWLDFMSSLDPKTVIPGHGPICGTEVFNLLDIYLEDIIKLGYGLVVNQIDSKTFGEISLPERYKQWWFEDFFEYNLHFITGWHKSKNGNE